nr:(6-4)DNA photolyase [Ipomoea batatas]
MALRLSKTGNPNLRLTDPPLASAFSSAMAATFRCFRTTPIQCFSSSSSSANRSKADPSSSKQTSGSNWWAPLFGPNFINGSVPANTNEMKIQAAAEEIPFQRLNLEVDGGRSKFRPGCFTEEKAVELRKVTIQTSTFHDKMYHSAIATWWTTSAEVRHLDQGRPPQPSVTPLILD